MSLLASCLLFAAVLGVICQGQPSSLSYLRQGRTSDDTSTPLFLQKLPKNSLRRDEQHELLGTFHRHGRDVPPSSYYPTPSIPFPFPSRPPTVSVPVSNQVYTEDNYNGEFKYSFETEDGIKVLAKGFRKIMSNGEVVQRMEGQYSYTAPDGTPIITKWFADETGFHAEGAHIPGSTRKR